MRAFLLEIAAGVASAVAGISLWALPTDTPIIGRPPLLIGWALVVLGALVVVASIVARLPLDFQSPVRRIRDEQADPQVAVSGITLGLPISTPLAPPSQLIARYDQTDRYRHADEPGALAIFQHRLGVYNPGDGTTAERVRVHLVGMAPYPRNDGGRPPVIPYAPPLLSGGNENVGVSLQPGREELWVIGYTATGSDGSMNAGNLSDQDHRWRGLLWRLEPDERWRFVYRIVAEGRADVEFSIVVTAEAGSLRCDLEG